MGGHVVVIVMSHATFHSHVVDEHDKPWHIVLWLRRLEKRLELD
jgi:hypothetical protein